jgi:hypothetical protein
MRRTFLAACWILVVPALWVIVADRRETSAQEAAPVAQKRFVEVGKTYQVWFSALAGHRCKVLEAPRDQWVRVEFVEEKKPIKGWVNLDLIMAIQERE